MVYGGYSYLDEGYEPDPDGDLVVLHWVRGRFSLEKLAEALAAESSVGTWTEIKTINDRVLREYRARVFRLHKVGETSGFVWIAYPLEHFDARNIAQVLASIRGNVYGLTELEALKFLDIRIPRRFQEFYKGPGYGIEGIRERVGSTGSGRPHVGTIVKPKVGLAPGEWADVAYEAWMGGCDFVKDDENLVDQPFCRFEERVMEVLERVDRVKEETGRRVMYAPNITDRWSRMLERMDFLKSQGWDVAMLDVYMMGYPMVQEAVETLHERGFIVHAHRAGHTAETRGEFGANYAVFAKIWRLLGVDQLHTGTGVGKMEGSPLLIRRYGRIVRERHIPEALELLSLGQEWSDHIRSVMPVASGGLDPGRVDALAVIYGRDFVAQAGGGIHGHPDGTRAGARALRAAAEAVAEGVSSVEKAGEVPELKRALDKWGYVNPEDITALFSMFEENADIFRGMLFSMGYEAFEVLEKMGK
ncbi:MAG: ribulose-bisphosphate carboxylase large subunit [Thermoplasmata archaeon]|nr:ribulose-bisphosphate carboxylase large subunit [Thermoplasmata archaeon]